MLKNRWDQVKIPASEIRFSKTFRFVAQVDAFLVIFHFWATIRLCFTTRIAWRFPEAESSLGVMEYHRFSIFENAKNFQGNCNGIVIFDKFPGDQVPILLGGGTASVETKNACEAYVSRQEARRLRCAVEGRSVIHGVERGETGAW